MSEHIDSAEEIISGEGVAIDVQPLGFFMRTLGALIDMLVCWALYILFFWMRAMFFIGGITDVALDSILVVVATVTCFLIVPMVIEMALKGRSLGKLAVGGQIVRIDGGMIGARHAFIRALLGVLEIYMTFGSVAFMFGAFTARSQRLGDMVAGTYSQRVRARKLNHQVPVMPPQLAEWSHVADVARMPDRLARRISQFLQYSPQMTLTSRTRIAGELCTEAQAYVSPWPHGAHPEDILRAVTVVRRGRERQALANADARAEKLTGRQLSVR